MTRCWIRHPERGESAGPFSLEELRGLFRAGLLTEDTQASLSAYEGFRAIGEWPELTEALATPGVAVLRGAPALKLGEPRHVVPDTAGPESLVPEARESTLRLGRVEYTDANAADTAPARDAVAMLRANRDAEAEPVLHFPPLYKHPTIKNISRFLPFAVAGGALVWFGVHRLDSGDPFGSVGMLALGGLLLGGGAFFVFFVSPSRWGMD